MCLCLALEVGLFLCCSYSTYYKCGKLLRDLLLYTRASICLPSLYTFLLLSVAFSQLRTRKVKKVSYFYYFYFFPYFCNKNNIEINAETSSAEEDEVALGVAQLAAFQVVLIFTAVAAILALTCRLRVFSSHEPARLKVPLDI
jgi:hypothetical protein